MYDLGGGTFDISILRLTQGVFEVIATGATLPWGATTTTPRWPTGCWPQLGCTAHSAADKAAVRLAARACKEALTDY